MPAAYVWPSLNASLHLEFRARHCCNNAAGLQLNSRRFLAARAPRELNQPLNLRACDPGNVDQDTVLSLRCFMLAAGKKTLTSREIQTGVRLLLGGELAKHAVMEGTKAVTRMSQ